MTFNFNGHTSYTACTLASGRMLMNSLKDIETIDAIKGSAVLLTCRLNQSSNPSVSFISVLYKSFIFFVKVSLIAYW